MDPAIVQEPPQMEDVFMQTATNEEAMIEQPSMTAASPPSNEPVESVQSGPILPVEPAGAVPEPATSQMAGQLEDDTAMLSDSSDLPSTSDDETSSDEEIDDSKPSVAGEAGRANGSAVRSHRTMTEAEYAHLKKKVTAMDMMRSGGGQRGDIDHDDDEDDEVTGPLRTKNEVEPPVPVRPQIPNLDSMPLLPLGVVRGVLGDSVIVAQDTMRERRALDIGSVLILENRQVLGEIFDTFGPIVQPMYTIRFASESEPIELGVQPGNPVYYVASHVAYVLTQELHKMKGSDASNRDDEEVSEAEIEFSDDEKEQEHRRRLKGKRRGKNKAPKKEPANAATTAQPPTARPAPSVLSSAIGQAAMAVDPQELYVPLARPMPQQPPQQQWEYPYQHFSAPPPPPNYDSWYPYNNNNNQHHHQQQ